MICLTLRCFNSHSFDAWFPDTESFYKQKDMKLVACPHCGICDVDKAIMAPNLNLASAKADKTLVDPKLATKQELRAAKANITSTFENVGDNFAQEATRIHNKESPERPIYGKATTQQAKDLMDEGIDIFVIPDLEDDA